MLFRQGIKLKKQRSTGDLEKKGAGSGSIRSTGSSASWVSTDSAQSAMTNASIPSDSNASFVVEVKIFPKIHKKKNRKYFQRDFDKISFFAFYQVLKFDQNQFGNVQKFTKYSNEFRTNKWTLV